MSRNLIFSILLAGASMAPLRSQPAGVGKIVRNDPALDKLVPAAAKIEKIHERLSVYRRAALGAKWRIPAVQRSDRQSHHEVESRRQCFGVSHKGIFAGSFPDGVQIGSNGLTLDREGRVVAAEPGNRA